MTERIPKILVAGVAILVPLWLAYLAYSRPGYFTSQACLGVLLLEFLAAAVWMYRRFFFPVLLMAFLFAGLNLPVGAAWTALRWLFLAVGALVGALIMLKDRGHHFGLFHTLASFAILTALISASVSRYPNVALLKALSLFLLFVYGGTGARIAVTGRENRFFTGLVTGCEVFVGANAFFYAIRIAAMGNPNSLGAVMGVFAAPILLWGALLGGKPSVQQRRWVLYGICMYLIFLSHARAGLAASLLSCGLLCLALRRYKLLIEGFVILVILIAAAAIFRPGVISSLTSSVVYKGVDQEQGVLASRASPWRTAVNAIHEHPWFGTGLGTTATGTDASEEQSKFESVDLTAENGSSYLAILSGVGVLGTVPFFLLLLLLADKILRTVRWMLQSGSAVHPAIPLAMVMFAGIVHAGFEDWMFAPGNYLCVFFWSLAFILADVAPSSRVTGAALAWYRRPRQQGFAGVAPSS